ncbi:MAG: amidohydrolase family protein [Dokdonella sp.]
MTPMQAIQSATTSAADLLSRADKVGTRKPGYYADLIAVDPLANVSTLEHPRFVMKGGTVIKSAAMH